MKIVYLFQKYLDRFLYVMAAVEHCLIKFFLCQLSVYIKRNFRLPYVRSQKPLKCFQTYRRTRHHVIVIQGDLPQLIRKLPAVHMLDNDKITYFFWIKTTKDPFQDILIIVAAIVPGPNNPFMLIIEPLKLIPVIDDHSFFLGVQVDQDNKPIMLEYLEIIKNHPFTFFSGIVKSVQRFRLNSPATGRLHHRANRGGGLRPRPRPVES